MCWYKQCMKIEKETYLEKEEIERVVKPLKNFGFKELKKTKHYDYSVAQKNTDERFIEGVYSKFDNIKLVRKKEKESNISYDLHYELEDGTYVLIAVSFTTSPPTLINAFHVKKNFKRFKTSLLKYYNNPN